MGRPKSSSVRASHAARFPRNPTGEILVYKTVRLQAAAARRLSLAAKMAGVSISRLVYDHIPDVEKT